MTDRHRPSARPVRWSSLVGGVLVALWILVQLAYRTTFIYHDSWRAGFPILFSLGRDGTCTGPATWIGRLDTGSPTLLYVISFSVTHLLRLPALYLTGCFQLGLIPAMYLTKAQIALSYLAFSGSMFFLGTVLYRRRLAALYLAAATLYAGLSLDAMHSDQVVTILFWVPWVIACAVLACRHRSSPAGGWYLNGSVLFLCVEALDQYPHFPLLVASAGGAIAAAVWPHQARHLLRHQARRLWPAAILVLVTAAQLAVIRDAVVAYQPGQNRDLVVEPAAFDETGFVQPTAVIGSFLPLGFLAGFERLADGMAHWVGGHPWLAPRRGFIFRLDSLLFNLGFIPTVLVFVFAIRPGMRRARLWWLATAALVLLVSLQQSRLYLLLFHVPFFNVFRAYFLYIAFVVLAALIMSGYGMDAYLTLSPPERRRILDRSLAIAGVTAIGAAWALWLLSQASGPRTGTSGMVRYTAIDTLVAGTGAALMWFAGRGRDPDRWAIALTLAVALSGTVHAVGVYRLVGMSLPEVVATYRLDADDSTPLPYDVARDPDRFRRKPCTSFAQCYASLRDTAAIARFDGEWRGAFWRSKDDAIFEDGVKPSVVAALAGVGHPVFWLSREAVPYRDRGELVARLNAHSERIGDYLAQAVSVRDRDLGTVRVAPAPTRLRSLTSLGRGRDRFRLTYESDGPAVLNGALTYDRHWIARVNGVRMPILRGNFNGLAVPVPRGSGTVELAYESWPSRLFFGSRYLMLLLSVAVVARLTRPTAVRATSA